MKNEFHTTSATTARRRLAVLALASALLCAPLTAGLYPDTAEAAPTYKLQQLPNLPGLASCWVTAASDPGTTAVGQCFDGPFIPVYWSNGKVSTLAPQSQSLFPAPTAINNSGEVIGTYVASSGTGPYAFYMSSVSNSTVTPIPIIKGASTCTPYSINSNGEIVGACILDPNGFNEPTGTGAAFYFTPASGLVAIPNYPGCQYTMPSHISDDGTIWAYSNFCGSSPNGVFFSIAPKTHTVTQIWQQCPSPSDGLWSAVTGVAASGETTGDCDQQAVVASPAGNLTWIFGENTGSSYSGGISTNGVVAGANNTGTYVYYNGNYEYITIDNGIYYNAFITPGGIVYGEYSPAGSRNDYGYLLLPQ